MVLISTSPFWSLERLCPNNRKHPNAYEISNHPRGFSLPIGAPIFPDKMSSKQRPRPRPKPHAHKTDGAPSISPLETGPPNDPPQLKDNDDFFIKNRGFDEIKARAERMCVLVGFAIARVCSCDHPKAIERQKKRETYWALTTQTKAIAQVGRRSNG